MTPIDTLIEQLEFDAKTLNWKTFHEAAIMLRQQEKELTEAGHMIGVLREYISDLEKGLESSIKLNKAQAERST